MVEKSLLLYKRDNNKIVKQSTLKSFGDIRQYSVIHIILESLHLKGVNKATFRFIQSFLIYTRLLQSTDSI